MLLYSKTLFAMISDGFHRFVPGFVACTLQVFEAHHQLVNPWRVVMGLPFVSGTSMESSKDDGG